MILKICRDKKEFMNYIESSVFFEDRKVLFNIKEFIKSFPLNDEPYYLESFWDSVYSVSFWVENIFFDESDIYNDFDTLRDVLFF